MKSEKANTNNSCIPSLKVEVPTLKYLKIQKNIEKVSPCSFQIHYSTTNYRHIEFSKILHLIKV